MVLKHNFEVIIIGGSYAGLSAALALSRSLRNVLIIDSGRPCNRQTPHSHNFITHDGDAPKEIASKAKEEIFKYGVVKFYDGLAADGVQSNHGFEIKTDNGDIFTSRKLLFATGITDLHTISGAAECWGISVLHCPYCHGYEVRNENIGVVGNGDMGYEFVKLISNWTKRLTLFTNGKSALSPEQTEKLKSNSVKIEESEIEEIEHLNGSVQSVVFKDKKKFKVTAFFMRPDFRQHCDIPEKFGCEKTGQGYIKVDDLQRTNVPGVYAAGDNSNFMRSVSAAVAAGNKAGAAINKELIEENF